MDEVVEITAPLCKCKDCATIKTENIKIGTIIELLFKKDIIEQLKLRNEAYIGVIGTIRSIRLDQDDAAYSITLKNNGSGREFLVSGIEKIRCICANCAAR